MAAPTLDLRTYLLLERAFVRRLQRSWRLQSAPIYGAIAEHCRNHQWDRARLLVPDLDMTEVGTENREWITYMLLSFAVFGAGTVSRKQPSFVGVGTFDTFLKQVTGNFLQYLELNATTQIQAEALQSIAEDEAKTKALKWDPDQLRDAHGRFAKTRGPEAVTPAPTTLHVITGAFRLEALKSPNPDQKNRKFMMDPKTGTIIMGGFRQSTDEPLGGYNTHAEILATAMEQHLIPNPGRYDYDRWVRGELSFSFAQPSISIYNKEEFSQFLPGGKDDPKAALFNATWATLERFVAAGAPDDTRIELQSDWSRGTLKAMFPQLRRKWDESQHPRDGDGQFTDKPGAQAPQLDAGTGGGRGVAVPAKAPGRPDAVPRAQAVADAYNAQHGFPPVQHAYAALDEARAGSIADAYDALPLHDEDNPEVQTAYEALATEVQAQWDHITGSGVAMIPWTQAGQPYQTSTEMAADVRDHQRLYFFTGGDPNRFMAAVDAQGLSINDKFRAVHDYFGHAAGGYGFGARGEENAWMSHSQMLSPEARRALTTETRGQNSWVNFGRHNYEADGTYKKIPPGDRPFATQKAALFPDSYALLPWEMVLKWDESQHPRNEDGEFTRVAMTSQRTEGDPGHQTNKDVFQHMREFHTALQALPGVSHVSVKPSVGGWDGGSEAMWQIYYKGNGEAAKLIARTAKQFNQDAVLILKKCKGDGCQPAVELSFDKGVSPRVRDRVHALLVTHGIGGWTWMKRDGKTLLRMVSVPQWGGEAEAHQKATTEVSQALRADGLPNHRRVRKVRVEVLQREGDYSYDHVIGS